jgi:S-DNA-T family DNA segregation ATPase FtsK/SpoIIIE
MASKGKKRANSRKPSGEIPLPPPLISENGRRRLRQLCLVGGIIGVMYILVALATYAPTDPAFSRTGKGAVANAAGPVGAWLSDVIFQVLGYGGWALAGLIPVFGFKLGRRRLGGWVTAVAAVVTVWALLACISLVAPGGEQSAFPAGGLVGLIAADTLLATVGPAGAWFVVVFSLACAAPFVFGIDWGRVAEGIFRLIEGRVPAVGGFAAQSGRHVVRGIGWSGRALTGTVASTIRRNINWDKQPAAVAEIPIDSPEDEAELVPVALPLDENVSTPTVHAVEIEPSFIDDAEERMADDPEDRTIHEVPDLVEVEWEATMHGVPAESETPPSLDAALLTAGSLSGVEVATTSGRLSHPGVHEHTGPVGVAVDILTGDVQVTPGELVSGGDDDGGLVMVEPETWASFDLPHIDLLDSHPRDVARFNTDELQVLAQTLVSKLADFNVKGEVVAIRPGPVITTFEYAPAPGVKISRIANLTDDIAMALRALRVRIVAPIPGKGVVGIEIPNNDRQTVWFRDMLSSDDFRDSTLSLPMTLGKTVEGRPRVTDLAKMPHLLVGGTTGSGKSVAINAMLLSMLFARTPEELRMILIDPKMLEFELYRDIPHLLHPVVTDPRLASAALKWACTEMDERYRVLSRWKCRNIASYNQKVEQEMEDWTPEKARRYAPVDWPEHEPPPPPQQLPFIVIVIDELADLMMVAAKDVEESIIRIAQKARAAGIHLIVATQRPSVNVITGLIKANMPSRIAFQVRTKVDGRTILDQNGAETLLGMGDMLFLPPGVSSLERLHGPFLSDEEVRNVTEYLRLQGSPRYEADITASDGDARSVGEEEYDELYDRAVAYVCMMGKASSSMIQREFKIGYNRAARMIEVMEREGLIGAADGARPREVLVSQQTG